MTPTLRFLLLLLSTVVLVPGCMDTDPHAQQRSEDERRYFEARLETMEAELRGSLTNLPAERILALIGPEMMARQAQVAQAEARGLLMDELRAELSVEMDLRCEELCAEGLLDARRADRKEAEAGRDRALEEIRKLRKVLDLEQASLDKAWKTLEEERVALAEAVRPAAAPVSCSQAGDAAFQEGLYGDALSEYRQALKTAGTPECHRVLALIYGALGYKENQAKHLTDYLHLMRQTLAKQQVAMIQAELRAAKR
ncbi:MAG: hypothetical protein ABIK09_17145 [Pseudomonadota bacterium]